MSDDQSKQSLQAETKTIVKDISEIGAAVDSMHDDVCQAMDSESHERSNTLITHAIAASLGTKQLQEKAQRLLELCQESNELLMRLVDIYQKDGEEDDEECEGDDGGDVEGPE